MLAKLFRTRVQKEREAIRDRLVELGRKTGIEHLVAYHPETGRQIWMTDGKRHSVTMTDDVAEEIERTGGWETWHNHPASYANPSIGDFWPLTMPGICAIGVVDNDGEWSTAKLAGKWKRVHDDPDLYDEYDEILTTVMCAEIQMMKEYRALMSEEEQELLREPRRATGELRSELRDLHAGDAIAVELLGLVKLRSTIKETNKGPAIELARRAQNELLARAHDRNRSFDLDPAFTYSEPVNQRGPARDCDPETVARPETRTAVPQDDRAPARGEHPDARDRRRHHERERADAGSLPGIEREGKLRLAGAAQGAAPASQATERERQGPVPVDEPLAGWTRATARKNPIRERTPRRNPFDTDLARPRPPPTHDTEGVSR